jgi:hypothetical protein
MRVVRVPSWSPSLPPRSVLTWTRSSVQLASLDRRSGHAGTDTPAPTPTHHAESVHHLRERAHTPKLEPRQHQRFFRFARRLC